MGDLQRSSKKAAESWQRYCETRGPRRARGQGTYDPLAHSASFLRGWLAKNEVSEVGSGGVASLAKRVKDLQRTSKKATESGQRYRDTRFLLLCAGAVILLISVFKPFLSSMFRVDVDLLLYSHGSYLLFC